jgi:hypothetical protein
VVRCSRSGASTSAISGASVTGTAWWPPLRASCPPGSRALLRDAGRTLRRRT